VLADSQDVLAALSGATPATTARLQAARDMAAAASIALDEAVLAAERDGLLA
jgi:hypothetical protein